MRPSVRQYLLKLGRSCFALPTPPHAVSVRRSFPRFPCLAHSTLYPFSIHLLRHCSPSWSFSPCPDWEHRRQMNGSSPMGSSWVFIPLVWLDRQSPAATSLLLSGAGVCPSQLVHLDVLHFPFQSGGTVGSLTCRGPAAFSSSIFFPAFSPFIVLGFVAN